jgi:hypothetical protein
MENGGGEMPMSSQFVQQPYHPPYTSIDAIPFDREGGGGVDVVPMKGIRQFNNRPSQSYFPPGMGGNSSLPFSPETSQPGMQQMPSYSDLINALTALTQQNQQTNSSDETLSCKKIAEHLKSCTKCSRKYGNDTNTYLAIIIGLVLFILFLLTKIIDKFS